MCHLTRTHYLVFRSSISTSSVVFVIQSHVVQIYLFLLRTRESYDEKVSRLRQDENLKSLDGVKRDSVLNNLSYFHCMRGFPPDFLHYLLEGIVPLELCLCLKKNYWTSVLHTALSKHCNTMFPL